VYIFTFDLPIKWTRWTRVAAENRVGRVTVNRHIFFFGLIEQTT
jgi:acyl-CoA reductase-like NAD-dependent aldehyde dehydrogenase